MMQKKKHLVYKVTNQETGEAYIGVTTRSMDERKADHIQKANKGTGGYFQAAIATYGPDAFSWKEIDTASSNDELASKEIRYISEYDALESGYNSDRGGSIKKSVYQYNLDGSLNATFEDLTTAGKSINVRKQAISRACWSVNQTLGGYLWSYDYKEPFIVEPDNRKKQVTQFTLNGEILARYNSVAEASRITGLSKTCISRCCRGERRSSSGFLWKYQD
ncbi:NUMOD1 domain-containing DNA-binding protein [Flavobacterium xinjiangense]|uniref:NUMOD1 domain-containing protein n=1 Tax=Flavobacterium xinjiangense TaxID=178356 RepID=A0A1M7MHK4_9FLAO|nr:NUMOD1 domain-containing DNA-binding protein [Flavobacterium xinjiangense]SHM90341.1 NUMOD1 domain-containing protein [Flavobacterium xinjiangense]